MITRGIPYGNPTISIIPLGIAPQESLIGLAGFTDDCGSDEEGAKAGTRPWIDKGGLARRRAI